MAVRSQRRLLPYRDVSAHEIINGFALDGTGMAGALVKIKTCAPSNDYFYSSDSVGANFSSTQFGNITSNRWISPWKLAFTVSGDTRYDGILGLTLANVQEYDENGNKLIIYPAYKQYENNAVVSGMPIPVATRGIFAVNYTVYSGSTQAPSPTSVATASFQVTSFNGQQGQIDAVPKANIQSTANAVSGIYTEPSVIGQWMSSTGVERNGWALLKLRL